MYNGLYIAIYCNFSNVMADGLCIFFAGRSLPAKAAISGSMYAWQSVLVLRNCIANRARGCTNVEGRLKPSA